MASPLIIINLKAYREGYGNGAHLIAGIAETVGNESGVVIGVASGYTDIHPLSMHHSIPVYAQHVDGIGSGAHTGHILAETLRNAGAHGSLINHSERRLTLADISAAVEACKNSHLQSILCSDTAATSAAAATFSPDYIAIEPPELIGTGISVSKADPGIIKSSVNAVHSVNPDVDVLAGAGISTGECVRTAIELGASGVLLASGIVKAKNPEEVLRDLISGI